MASDDPIELSDVWSKGDVQQHGLGALAELKKHDTAGLWEEGGDV